MNNYYRKRRSSRRNSRRSSLLPPEADIELDKVLDETIKRAKLYEEKPKRKRGRPRKNNSINYEGPVVAVGGEGSGQITKKGTTVFTNKNDETIEFPTSNIYKLNQYISVINEKDKIIDQLKDEIKYKNATIQSRTNYIKKLKKEIKEIKTKNNVKFINL